MHRFAALLLCAGGLMAAPAPFPDPSKVWTTGWDKPVDKPCPACGAKYMVEKVSRSGTTLRCAAEGCGHREEPAAGPS